MRKLYGTPKQYHVNSIIGTYVFFTDFTYDPDTRAPRFTEPLHTNIS